MSTNQPPENFAPSSAANQKANSERRRSAMKRRNFLRLVALGSASAMTAPPFAIARPKALPQVPRSTVKPFELDEATIAEFQAGMKSGRYSSVSLVKKYLARIEQIDKHGPAINAVIETNPDAMEVARPRDEERKTKGPRAPLHGIPVRIKDII